MRVLLYEQRSRFDLSVLNKLLTLIREEGFDLVHAHGARANLIAAFSEAMGLLLGMTGSICIMLLISTVCFMKGVG